MQHPLAGLLNQWASWAIIWSSLCPAATAAPPKQHLHLWIFSERRVSVCHALAWGGGDGLYLFIVVIHFISTAVLTKGLWNQSQRDDLLWGRQVLSDRGRARGRFNSSENAIKYKHYWNCSLQIDHKTASFWQRSQLKFQKESFASRCEGKTWTFKYAFNMMSSIFWGGILQHVV